MKEKDRILHYVGYDSYNVKFVFANKSIKKNYITIDPSKIHEVISIMKMIPDIGMCVRDKDFVKCLFKPEPTYLGDTIPVSGNGDITNDGKQDI